MAYMTDKWAGNEYFKINDFHHVEFYVGNAKQAVYFYRSAFGFKPYAYAGPETGVKELGRPRTRDSVYPRKSLLRCPSSDR